MARILLLTFIVITSNHLVSGQNYIYDESFKDESFLRFKVEVVEAVVDKDTSKLFSLLADTVHLTKDACSYAPKECFMSSFRNSILPVSEQSIWEEMYEAVKFGFAIERDYRNDWIFRAPSFRKYFNDPTFKTLLVLGYNVNVREKPSIESNILTRLSFQTILYNNPMISDSSTAYNYINGKFWYEVILPDGKKGYIIEDYVSPGILKDVITKKFPSGWKITAISNGPGC